MIFNRIPIVFGGSSKVTTPKITYQYDVRQILVFQDLNLPEYYEVDISNEGDTNTVTMVGTADGVLIPSKYFRTGKKIKAYIIYQGTDPGATETRKEVTIPVEIRPAREDIDPSEPEQQQIDELVDILNDAVIAAMPTGGYTGQFLAKASDNDYATEWVDGGGGGGGTGNYNQLSNKPQINDVTLTGNKSLADLGIAAASDIPTVPVQSVNSKTGNVVLSASDVGAYELPSGGIPSTDLASAVQTSLGKADTALQSAPVTSVNNQTGAVVLTASDVGAYVKPYGGIPKTDLASGVQSSLNSADSAYQKPSGGIPSTDLASAVQTSLGKADTALQSVPSTYRTAADQDIIDATKADKTSYVTLTGTAITQTGADNTMYLCGELASLTFTAPQTGICAVRFTSGSTATVVTLNGVTMPDSWEGAEADTVYEINILNGYGLVAKWAVST